MRGSPLLQALLLAVVLALAGIPVWSLTRPHAHAEPARSSKTEPGMTAADLIVTSTAEAEVELALSGTTIWQGRPAAPRFEAALSLPPDAELVARVRWARSGTSAARFQVSRDGEQLADVTLWGDTEATDVLSVSPRPPAP
jgi:hypothetical protein